MVNLSSFTPYHYFYYYYFIIIIIFNYFFSGRGWGIAFFTRWYLYKCCKLFTRHELLTCCYHCLEILKNKSQKCYFKLLYLSRKNCTITLFILFRSFTVKRSWIVEYTLLFKKKDLLQPVSLATIFANCNVIQINLSNWLRSRQWLTNRVLLCANPGKNYRKIAISDNASWAHAPTSFLIQTNKTSILIFKITFPFTVKYMTEYHRCFRLHWISNHFWEPLSSVW